MQVGCVPIVVLGQKLQSDSGRDVAEPAAVVIVLRAPRPSPDVRAPVAPIGEADEILGQILAHRNHHSDVLERRGLSAAQSQLVVDHTVKPQFAAEGSPQLTGRREGRLDNPGRVLHLAAPLRAAEHQRLPFRADNVNPNR